MEVQTATDTAMSAAFEKVGWTKADMAAYMAAKRFFDAGGNMGQWIRIGSLASRGRLPEPHELDEGQAPSVESHGPFADIQPNNGNDGEGHSAIAHADLKVPRPVNPLKEPSAADMRARRRNAKAVAEAVWNIDGENLLDMTLGRVRSLLRARRAEEYGLSVVLSKGRHLPDTTLVREVISPDEVTALREQGKAYSNAH